jgi:hypothetical protein
LASARRTRPAQAAVRIANLPEWRAHLLTRLHRQAQATGDTRLTDLHDELTAYPGGESERRPATASAGTTRDVRFAPVT